MTKQEVPTLYRDGAFYNDDWQILDGESEISASEKVFVPFAHALELFAAQANLPEEFGLIVEPDDEVELLKPHLEKIAAIAVSFPAFGDGRGFSSARLLRERFGFKGEIRAIGHYILDQMPFLVRCGVDSFVVSSPKVRAGLERGEWPEVTHYYQPTGEDGEKPIASRPWLRRKTD